MSDQVDPLSEFTIALPTEEQYKLVLKAAHVAFGRGQSFEVRHLFGQDSSAYNSNSKRKMMRPS